MPQNQETNLQVITELRKKQGLYEEEIETLKNDVENFKVQLDNERKYAFPISYVSAHTYQHTERTITINSICKREPSRILYILLVTS